MEGWTRWAEGASRCATSQRFSNHWQHGRSIQAIAASLGLDRKTVRKYVGLAEQAGFQPGQRPVGLQNSSRPFVLVMEGLLAWIG